MKTFILIFVALMVLQGTAAAYSYNQEFTINGEDWTNLSTAINVDYIANATVTYSGIFTSTDKPYYIDPNLDYIYIKDNLSIGDTVYIAEKTEGYSPDGNAVFMFFDDYTTFDSETWTTLQGGIYTSGGELQLLGTTGTRGLIESTQAISYPCIYESRMKTSTTGYDSVHVFSMREYGNWNNRAGDVYSNRFSTYANGAETATTPLSLNTPTSYHKYSIVYELGKSTLYQDEILMAQHTTNVPSVEQHIVFYESNNVGIDAYIDWSRIRKYAANEPTISVIDKGAYYEILVSSQEELTDYQIQISCASLNIISDSESWKISNGFDQINITPRAKGGMNGTTTVLNETKPYGNSTININGIETLQYIEHIISSDAQVNALFEINYNIPHAVLKSPANNTTYYQNQDPIIQWYSNPSGTTATYTIALDPDFYSIVQQGTTTSTSVLLPNLDYGTYYWKTSMSEVDTETRVFTKANQLPPGLFNFTAYNEETFSQINSYTVKLYNDSWFKEKSTTDGEVLYNSSEVQAGEYTALISSSGFSPRWYVVNSPSNVSVYLPSDSSTVRLCDFNLMDYTNKFNYPDTRLIVTKTTQDQGTITVSDRYFDASGSNPVYLLDYNNYILTLENIDGYQKSIGSYLPIANGEVSLVVGEIATIPDTSTHGGFNYNITKDNGAIVLQWNAPSGSLNSAFDYNITIGNSTVYEITSLSPYGTATYYMTSNDTHLIRLYADTTGGIVDHQEYYRPQNQLVDLNVSDFWYNVFGMFGLIVMGLLFSFRSAKTGAILVSFCAVALSAIGMLHISTTVLSLAVVVAIAGKLSEDKQT